MPNPVVHWEISSREPERLHEFYRNLFGWKIDANNEYKYGVVDTGGEGINGGIGGGVDQPADVVFYVQVDDLQQYLDRAREMGAKVLMTPTEIPGAVTMAQFEDPEGHRVGLIKG